jgi:hypothetical protein
MILEWLRLKRTARKGRNLRKRSKNCPGIDVVRLFPDLKEKPAHYEEICW